MHTPDNWVSAEQVLILGVFIPRNEDAFYMWAEPLCDSMWNSAQHLLLSEFPVFLKMSSLKECLEDEYQEHLSTGKRVYLFDCIWGRVKSNNLH